MHTEQNERWSSFRFFPYKREKQVNYNYFPVDTLSYIMLLCYKFHLIYWDQINVKLWKAKLHDSRHLSHLWSAAKRGRKRWWCRKTLDSPPPMNTPKFQLLMTGTLSMGGCDRCTKRSREELPHARGQGRRPGGPTPRPSSGGCTGGPRGAIPRRMSGRAAVRRYPSSKVRSSGCALLEQPWRDTPCPR